jgi:hypothetical protein
MRKRPGGRTPRRVAFSHKKAMTDFTTTPTEPFASARTDCKRRNARAHARYVSAGIFSRATGYVYTGPLSRSHNGFAHRNVRLQTAAHANVIGSVQSYTERCKVFLKGGERLLWHPRCDVGIASDALEEDQE